MYSYLNLDMTERENRIVELFQIHAESADNLSSVEGVVEIASFHII